METYLCCVENRAAEGVFVSTGPTIFKERRAQGSYLFPVSDLNSSRLAIQKCESEVDYLFV